MSQSFEKRQAGSSAFSTASSPQSEPGSRTLNSTGRHSCRQSACVPEGPKDCCLCGQPLRGEDLPTSSAHGTRLQALQHMPSVQASKGLGEASLPPKKPPAVSAPLRGSPRDRLTGSQRGRWVEFGRHGGGRASPWSSLRETTVERVQEAPSHPSLSCQALLCPC